MKITVVNNEMFNNNVAEILKTFNIKLLENLNLTSNQSNKIGFSVKKELSNVLIEHSSVHYFYHGLAYLLMNLNESTYTYSNVSKIKNTGIMLDTARNAVPKIETLKTYIQMMSLLGYNYLELYVEDVFEVLNEPKIGYMRGKYSIKDLKSLDDYAYSYGVEIVPCIQTLAHLERIFMHDTYHSINDIEDVLLVGEERTYELIENMLKTTKETFRSNRINIGMDEAFRLGLGQYLTKNGYQTKTEIMLKHLAEVGKLLKKYNYNGMMWADMFFQMSGGNYHLDNIEITDEIIKNVPKDITLIFWEYYDTAFETYDRKFKQIRRMTNNYSFAGGAWKWCGFTPLNKFTLKAMDSSIAACRKHNVDDFLVTAWGDDGAEASHYSILPSLIYASLAFYEIDNKQKVYDDFSKLISNYTFEELMELDTLNILNNKLDIHNPSKYLLYDDMFMGRLDYTVSNTFSEKYKNKTILLKNLIDKKSKFTYIFDTQFHLAKVLELKTKLTNLVYNYYKSSNIKGLLEVIPMFDELVNLLDNFYEAFKTQWHIENKDFGFEVQNYRIGGLKSRIIYIQEQINKYINKDIDHIEALDEKIINKNNHETVAYNGFLRTVTYGKM